MNRLKPSLFMDVARRSFWLLPAVAMLAGGILGFVVPLLDDASNGRLGIFTTSDSASARGLLQTIATVTVSVAGIAFSVTVIALQLASQQLSPRVLRTFQTDRLSRVTLAAFLGVFVYALIALGRLQSATGKPNLVLTVGVAGAVVAFALFAAFIHNVIVLLQAETVIDRIGRDARPLLERRFPAGIGTPAAHPEADAEELERRLAAGCFPLRAGRGGFFNAIDGDAVLAAAREEEGIAVQRAALGDFVLSGTTLVEIAADADREAFASKVHDALELGRERTLVQDIAFPIRQLADITLRGLSPGVNDPTTAETAMSQLADLLLRAARTEPPCSLRADPDGVARFVAITPSMDDLVLLGFDQVRVAAAELPTFNRRLVALLDQIGSVAAESGHRTDEIGRQIGLLRSNLQ